MTETLCVLALDAADYHLVKRWECEHILQQTHGSLEVFAHTFELPYTPEVWTTVATGDSPECHGIAGDAKRWDNPLLQKLATITQYFPGSLREVLGAPFRMFGATQSFNRTPRAHVFDMVFGWPGISEARHLQQAWDWYSEAEKGKMTTDQLNRNLLTNTGQEFGWLAAASRTNSAIVGAHTHALDVAGHIYANRPQRLRNVYEQVNDLVGWLRSYVDKLVILSDHGMQTDESQDEEPGRHSWRAFISSQGIAKSLPESVYDVRDWLESQSGETTEREEHVKIDTPMDHLQDLGYIDS